MPKTKATAYAENNCSNYRAGKCDGIWIDPDGKSVRWMDYGSTCLVGCNARCRYFETSVIQSGIYPKDEFNSKSLRAAQADYLKFNMRLEPEAPIRSCTCGAPLEKGRRKCDSCRDQARRKTNRKSVQAWRRRQKPEMTSDVMQLSK